MIDLLVEFENTEVEYLLGNAIREILVFGIVAHVDKWQHGEGVLAERINQRLGPCFLDNFNLPVPSA